jgi:O-antigen/teichoic acid export membrane protein
MLKQVFSHTFLYAVGPQIPKIINLLLLPIFTQYLTANDYGIYGLAIAYISAMTAIKDLGMTQTMVNIFTNSKNTNRWLIFWKQQMGILTLWSIIYSAILSFIIYLVFNKLIGANIFST